MSCELIIHWNQPKKSGFSKYSNISFLRNGKIIIKKILDIKMSRSGGVIEFGSSILTFIEYWKRFDSLRNSIWVEQKDINIIESSVYKKNLT